MRAAIALALIGWTMLCSGCALFQDGSRNLCHSLCTPFETHRENSRNRRWAEEAWCQVSGGGGPSKQSEDYAQGFKDGYAEYLYRGGDGEPPLIAPSRYRHVRYQSPNGYLAIEDWFAGYRHGAGVVRDSGARQFITGPLGLRGESFANGTHESPPSGRDNPLDEPKHEIILPPRLEPIGTNEGSAAGPRSLLYEAPKLNPAAVALDPPDAKPAEPARPKITNISEAPEATVTLDPPGAKQAEPARLKIKNISEAPEPVRVKIMKLIESPEAEPVAAKARITGISTPEPVRARITTITVAPKD